MSGYALPAPRIGDEGLPLILVAVLVASIATGGLIYWGSKNKKAKEQALIQASR